MAVFEDSIIYSEAGEVRRIRGVVEDEKDPLFVTISRREGKVKISKATIIRIEYAQRGEQ